MKPRQRHRPQPQTISSACQNQRWLLSFLVPLEREFLSTDCSTGQNLEGISRD